MGNRLEMFVPMLRLVISRIDYKMRIHNLMPNHYEKVWTVGLIAILLISFCCMNIFFCCKTYQVALKSMICFMVDGVFVWWTEKH